MTELVQLQKTGENKFPVTKTTALLNQDGLPFTSDLDYLNARTKQNYMGKIRVATYNSLSLLENISTIQAWLKKKHIHHMGLQETRFSAQKLEDLKFLDFETPVYLDYGWGTLAMGVFETLATAFYEIQGYTSSQPDAKRGLMKIETFIHGKRVSLYNTHVSANLTEAETLAEYSKIIQVMDADPNLYKILTGDFNAQKTSFFDQFLTNYKISNGKDGVWLDTWKYTSPYSTKAIDNIIVTKNIDILNVEVDTDLTLSDHRAIFADLILK